MRFKLLESKCEETLSDILFKTYHKRFAPLDEANLKRVAQGHDDSGYVILSASKKENRYIGGDTEGQLKGNANELNDKLTLEMKKAINSKNLTFVSTYGGYREKTGVVVEKSFIVYPYRRNNILVPWDEFIKDVLEIVNKTYVDENGDEQLLFNQESILVKKPNESPKYINPKNEETVIELGDNVDYNNLNNEYFTALKKWGDMSLNRKNHTWDKGLPQRFSVVEMFLEPEPSTSMESHSRYLLGELFNHH